MAEMANLTSLPLELIHDIVGMLGLQTFFRLKQVNRAFNSYLRFESLQTRPRHEFLQDADRFDRNKNVLGCFHCSKMLPKNAFGDGQRIGKRRKYGSARTSDRFCLSCGAKKLLYGHMVIINIQRGKESLYLCHKCGRYGTRGRRCGIPGVELMKKLGGRDFKDPRWVCWRSYPPPVLDQLPRQVVNRVISHLPYLDALHLSATCTSLRSKVDFNAVPLHQRFILLFKKRPQLTELRTSRACYACFRVRPRDRFTKFQQMHVLEGNMQFWKRRCRSCLYKMHANLGHQEAFDAWSRQEICNDGCGCLKFQDEECVACREGWHLEHSGTLPKKPRPSDKPQVPTKPQRLKGPEASDVLLRVSVNDERVDIPLRRPPRTPKTDEAGPFPDPYIKVDEAGPSRGSPTKYVRTSSGYVQRQTPTGEYEQPPPSFAQRVEGRLGNLVRRIPGANRPSRSSTS